MLCRRAAIKKTELICHKGHVKVNCAPLPKDNFWYSLNLKYDATEQDVRALNIDKLTVLGICLLPEPWREI